MSTATEPTIEQRLAALEEAVAELRQQRAESSTVSRPELVGGITKDEPASPGVNALGEASRRPDRPADEQGPPPPISASAEPAHDGPEPVVAEASPGLPIKRAKLDDQGRLIPLTPAEAQAEAEAIRAMLEELRSIPSDPDEDDAEFFRAIDSHRPHRPLFEGLY